jgi:hypothetical protein
MTDYPTAVWSPTTKTDGVDYPQAEHINSLQNEVVAIETQLGVNFGSGSTDGDILVYSSSDGWTPVAAATIAEVNTGTDTSKRVTPDALAGSYAGTAAGSGIVQSGTITTGDGKLYIAVPTKCNGMNLVEAVISVITKSTSGTPTVMLARGRQADATTAHAFVDMLSTALTIDANEFSSTYATTPAVINTSNDDVLTGDLIRVDIDTAGTGTANLYISLGFRLP